ncbi:MAG: hypothetical protein VB112_01800 [Oscillospiraceae bacterium]|nr:hypothetical protein [Oscillospiraceae bacterium]
MKKEKMTPLYIIVAALIIVTVLFFVGTRCFSGGRAHIVLPGTEDASNSSSGDGGQTDSVVRVEVNAENVQDVISTLSRPEAYSCSMTIETFYSAGSGTTTVSARVDGGYTRADMKLTGGQTRHVIYGGDKVYIWYNSERSYYSGSAGAITADEEERIPTYEDVLEIAPGDIAEADYRTLGDFDCIYVESKSADREYADFYWVDVNTGLLVSSEKQKNGETVYRMSASDIAVSSPDAAAFTLPDGTVIHVVGS